MIYEYIANAPVGHSTDNDAAKVLSAQGAWQCLVSESVPPTAFTLKRLKAWVSNLRFQSLQPMMVPAKREGAESSLARIAM